MIRESIQCLQVPDKIFCSSIQKKGVPQLDMISTNICNNKNNYQGYQVQGSLFRGILGSNSKLLNLNGKLGFIIIREVLFHSNVALGMSLWGF